MKFFFLLFLLSPGCLYADWNVIQRRDSTTSKGEATASELTLSDGASRAEVQLVYFTPTDIRFETVTNLDGKIQGIRDAVDSRGGSAGINGGYFETNLDPLGLLISNNKVLHPLQKAKLLSGIFF
ncbi:MAG: hypothetical protein JO070_05470, partial [Verrucomicrobia bacterium]|nr:hypothetical protein [Verrucomicrobiota bacterium]